MSNTEVGVVLLLLAISLHLHGLADLAASQQRAQWRQVYWLKVAAQKECK